MLGTILAVAAMAAPCPFSSPCVLVSPDTVAHVRPGTVQTFSGRGLRPRSTVRADWGSYCSGSLCAGVGLSTQFAADARGRFRFRFRIGSRDPVGRGPKGAGGGEVSFSVVSRGGRHVVLYGVPVPPPSSPAQRSAARAVGRAVVALQHAITAAAPQTQKATDAEQAELTTCADTIEAGRKRGNHDDAVITAVLNGQLAAATWDHGHAFADFADRLAALTIPEPRLAAAVTAWVTAIRTSHYHPSPDSCAVIDAWAQAGYAADAEPTPADTHQLPDDLPPAIIQRGTEALRDLGVSREIQVAFSGDVLGLENYLTEF